MAGSTPASPTAERRAAAARRAHVSPWREAWRRFRRHRWRWSSLFVLALMVPAVLLGPLVWRVPINEIDFTARLQARRRWAHPFGTDDLGQDLLARMLYGGRISLAVGLAAMVVAVVVGMLDRRASPACRAARSTRALMWLTDLFLSLPQLPLLLLLIYLFRDALKAVFGPEVRRLHPDRARDRRLPLDAGGAAGARAVPLAAREGVRRGRARARRQHAAAGGAPHPAQRAGPGDRRRHHRRRRRHHRRDRRCRSSAWASRPTSRPGAASCSTPRTTSTSRRTGRCSRAPAIFLTVLAINFIGDGLRDALDPRQGDVMAPLLEITRPEDPLQHRRRHGCRRSTASTSRIDARRDAVRGRRIRLRQDRHRDDGAEADRDAAGHASSPARSCGRAATSCRCRPTRCDDIRAKEIAIIFQEPMTSLNPVYTVGEQIAESAAPARGPVAHATRWTARSRCCALVQHPQRRSAACTTIRTSSPAACASA